MTATIRLATEADAPAVQAIYTPYVLYTPISFEIEPPRVAEIETRIGSTLVAYPWLVAENNQGIILGYAYAGKHRDRPAYQWSVDVSVYIDAPYRRSGLGRGLYLSLIALLHVQGFYQAFAGIALPNEPSVGLHTTLGFQLVGVYQRVGFKRGRWHDVAWYGLTLLAPSVAPIPPRTPVECMSTQEWHDALTTGQDLLRLYRGPSDQDATVLCR